MLLSLHIENIAIIEKSDIDFSDGFNVLTGETGAGKSIIIDSVNLLLGNKATKNLIRSGCDYAFVSAVFTDFNDFQTETLKESDVSPDEEGNVIVSRKITADGRTYSKINGVAVNVSTLKNISQTLVNIHGQRDGSKILDPATHVYYLDEFCNNSRLLNEYLEQYNLVKSIRNKIVELTQIKEKKEQLEESLKFKIEEIENAKIVVGELQKLKDSANIAANISSILSVLHNCDSALSNEETSVLDSVSEMIVGISSIEKILDGAKEMVEALKRAKAELEDVSETVSRKLSDYDDFDASPDFIEKRIYEIEKVLKKYGTEEAALNSLSEFKNELLKLEDNETELAEATEEYSSALNVLEQRCEKLSLNRKDNAKILSKQICEQLYELDMPNIRFEVSIKRNTNARGGNKYSALGYDAVEFFISPNAGQELKPLSKIASGGELSRIILCLKTILIGGNGECGTVIYDEVDSGVSGSTAQKIGIKLKKSAKDKQIFSITHLAQIAALADHHYKIEKKTENDITTSNIKLLSENEHIFEIARIMGGVEISDQILKSAKELINNSKMC